ncbi:hypothetical protein CLOSTMETH_00685 [[Clostridium] methylpentosum DSM 5476]|uniref:Uncharacterized protein n=1 Tax=[Clostridium] methylpentosum DSM 5476 TaxID=537013 RepID=C0EA31_9FIRM|nr:hypothetical protein CLOSTMETH_00685 [[Clostridium] methylpentosum DSM 5476]
MFDTRLSDTRAFAVCTWSGRNTQIFEVKAFTFSPYLNQKNPMHLHRIF